MKDRVTRDEIGQWTTEYRGRISMDADAAVLVRGQVTKQAIEKLIGVLELMSEDYPDAAEGESGHSEIIISDAREPVTITVNGRRIEYTDRAISYAEVHALAGIDLKRNMKVMVHYPGKSSQALKCGEVLPVDDGAIITLVYV